LASYVVVGGSETPKDVLLDALGMLFLYNLDRIGREMGFVDRDDWPGDRLGWIFQEMVKKDWGPQLEEDPEAPKDGHPMQLCVKGCCRPAAEGTDASGRHFDTCCRGCGNNGAHDDECDEKDRERKRMAIEERGDLRDLYEGGETHDWGIGGWLVLLMYNVTVTLLLPLAVVIPLLTAYTPFNMIVPELIGNQ